MVLSMMLLGYAWANAQWSQVYPTVDWGSINSIRFANPAVGVAVGDSTILRTTDSGQSWVKIPGNLKAHFMYVAFADENTGVATSTEGIWRSTDMGASWTK